MMDSHKNFFNLYRPIKLLVSNGKKPSRSNMVSLKEALSQLCEGNDSLSHQIISDHPHLKSEIEKVSNERKALLKELNQTIRSLRTNKIINWVNLAEDVRNLEIKLLQEAYSQDIGGEG